MAERVRREKKSRVNTSALDALENAKVSGVGRSKQLQIKDNKSMFMEVDEEEYAKLVAKRRQEDFVEDDGDDLGYRDDGEETWNRANDSGSDYEEDEKTAKKFKMQAVAEPKAVKEISPGMKRINEMFQGKSAAKPRASGPVDAGLSSVSASSAGGVGASSVKRKVDAANIEVDDLLCGLDKDLAGACTVKKKKVLPASRPAPRQPGALFPPSGRAPGKRRVPITPDSLLTKAGVNIDTPMPAASNDYETFDAPDAVDYEAPEEEIPSKDSTSAEPARSGGFLAVTKEEETAKGLCDINEADDWKLMRDAADKELEESKSEDDKPEIATDASSADLSVLLDEDGCLNFYWFDAYEEPAKPGRIYMFGKVKTGEKGGKPVYTSCCVHVDNVKRTSYILPREKLLNAQGEETDTPVDMIKHVFPEFSATARSRGIKNHRAKPVKRSYMYHFQDPEVPVHSDYLKVAYSAEHAALPSDLAGRSFKRVFGSTQSCMELFLLKRDLMGPCWLKISGVEKVASPVTWCKTELRVGDSKKITKMADAPESPPLVVMSLHMQTCLNEREHSNEVVMLSAMVHPEVSIEGPTDRPESKLFSFTGVRKLEGAAWPLNITEKFQEANKKTPHAHKEIHPNERALLGFFLAKMHTVDPDVIVGHNFVGFDLDVLLHRMSRLKIPQWSKLGRLRRTQMPKLQANAGGMGQATWGEKQTMAGRLICDTYIAAKENLRETTYTLTELTRTQLGKVRNEIDFHKVPEYFSKSDDLLRLIAHNENDSYLTLCLTFKLMILPLTKQLTTLAGNLWSRSLLSARAERVEYLLLHEFHRLKYVQPDKVAFNNKKGPAADDDAGQGDGGDDGEDNGTGAAEAQANPKKWSKRKKAAYSGGLVLDPKRGLYDTHIMVLDFNSLYPTIIQEYNICFTTVQPGTQREDDAGLRYDMPDKDGQQGILPKVIRTLVQRRRMVKDLIKKERDEVKLNQLDIRQTALKIMANSMYGCLGFTFSRFYAKPLAEMITMQGRELLAKTVEVTQNRGLDVVYGDTDSIFVNSGSTDYREAAKIAAETQKELNKMWRLLEVGLDGVYCPLLLLNKKKYACISVSERDGKILKKKERKGIDIVRRDWCVLAKRAGDRVLDFILSGQPVDEVVDQIHSYLKEVADDMQNDRIRLEEYTITKGLTKAPEEYSDAKSQPHVQAAIRMKAKGVPMRAGDHVPYVICADASATSFAQRAWDPESVEMAKGALSIDKNWYLESQLHPVISRLCAVIEGTDAGRLAECLGLDQAKFNKSSGQQRNAESAFSMQSQEVNRFEACEKLYSMCSDGLAREFSGAFVRDSIGKLHNGFKVVGVPDVKFDTHALRLQLSALTRKCLARYHDGWLSCTDDTCGHRTRNVTSEVFLEGDKAEFGMKCPVVGCGSKMRVEYTSEQLYLQLLYLKGLFDMKNEERKLAELNAARTQRNLPSIFPPTLAQEEFQAMQVMHDDCDSYMKESGYSRISLTSLFNFSGDLGDE